jgi:hypothetical protein
LPAALDKAAVFAGLAEVAGMTDPAQLHGFPSFFRTRIRKETRTYELSERLNAVTDRSPLRHVI